MWGELGHQKLGLPVFWSVPVHTTRKALLLADLPSPYLKLAAPCFLPSGPVRWGRTWRSLNRKIELEVPGFLGVLCAQDC